MIETGEGDSEGAAEGLMHEGVDNWVDSHIGVDQVVATGQEDVVTLM